MLQHQPAEAPLNDSETLSRRSRPPLIMALKITPGNTADSTVLDEITQPLT
jgi:hypothetical protein